MLHILANYVDSKGKIWSSEENILESSNNVAIRCGIMEIITTKGFERISEDKEVYKGLAWDMLILSRR